MRVDKYLWAIRVFKTRSLASKACAAGHVVFEDAPTKASRILKEGAELKVKKLPIWRSYKVLALPKSRIGAKLVPEYVVEITSDEELERYEMHLVAQKASRLRGTGRPTKKERRDLDQFKPD